MLCRHRRVARVTRLSSASLERTSASYPRGSIYTPIMELGSQNHSRDGLLGPNSIIVVYMDPLGM